VGPTFRTMGSVAATKRLAVYSASRAAAEEKLLPQSSLFPRSHGVADARRIARAQTPPGSSCMRGSQGWTAISSAAGTEPVAER
jgi:hypothetical protein